MGEAALPFGRESNLDCANAGYYSVLDLFALALAGNNLSAFAFCDCRFAHSALVFASERYLQPLFAVGRAEARVHRGSFVNHEGDCQPPPRQP